MGICVSANVGRCLETVFHVSIERISLHAPGGMTATARLRLDEATRLFPEAQTRRRYKLEV